MNCIHKIEKVTKKISKKTCVRVDVLITFAYFTNKNEKMLIYLIGMPGSGKSTVAKKLAKKLKYSFYDLDNMIEKEIAMSISKYFERYSEEEFRNIEREMLHKSFKLSNAVVATGGGTPCFFDNISEINKHGLSIYLKASTALIISRLNVGQKAQRPLLSNYKTPEEMHLQLTNLYNGRKRFYEQAHITTAALSTNIDWIAKLALRSIN